MYVKLKNFSFRLPYEAKMKLKVRNIILIPTSIKIIYFFLFLFCSFCLLCSHSHPFSSNHQTLSNFQTISSISVLLGHSRTRDWHRWIRRQNFESGSWLFGKEEQVWQGWWCRGLSLIFIFTQIFIFITDLFWVWWWFDFFFYFSFFLSWVVVVT